MLHLPPQLVNRFRRSRQERLGVLFVLAGFLLFWTAVIGLDVAVHALKSVTVIKP
jgi:hypothetical protein